MLDGSLDAKGAIQGTRRAVQCSEHTMMNPLDLVALSASLLSNSSLIRNTMPVKPAHKER
jgi:hypothetical protein